MRAPIYQGLRLDKKPRECVFEFPRHTQAEVRKQKRKPPPDHDFPFPQSTSVAGDDCFHLGQHFVCWMKAALNDASPLVLNSARMVVAAVLLAIFYRKKIAVLTKPALTAGVVVGVFLYLGYAFQTSGLKLTTPSKSAFLTGTSSVLVPLFLGGNLAGAHSSMARSGNHARADRAVFDDGTRRRHRTGRLRQGNT